jgi:hypothetical protein
MEADSSIKNGPHFHARMINSRPSQSPIHVLGAMGWLRRMEEELEEKRASKIWQRTFSWIIGGNGPEKFALTSEVSLKIYGMNMAAVRCHVRPNNNSSRQHGSVRWLRVRGVRPVSRLTELPQFRQNTPHRLLCAINQQQRAEGAG